MMLEQIQSCWMARYIMVWHEAALCAGSDAKHAELVRCMCCSMYRCECAANADCRERSQCQDHLTMDIDEWLAMFIAADKSQQL